MRISRLLAVALLASLAACGPKLIPGTNIQDTDETRAILDVMDKYRKAVESRDSTGVIALVADTFKDPGATPTADDDLDYARLREQLPQTFSRLQEVRLDMTIRKVEILQDQTARAVYTYNTSFKLPGLIDRPETASEIKEMWFKLVGDEWKIQSGI